MKLAAFLLLLATMPAAAQDWVGGGDARLDAAMLGRPGAQERLRAALAGGAGPARGWGFLCHTDYAAGDYAQGTKDCARAARLDPEDSASTAALVAALARQPAPQASGSAKVAIDKDGRVPAMVGLRAIAAIPDTGAQISVIMQSLARASGVKLLARSGKVGSTTAAVTGENGILPRIRIGNAVLDNVPVLVLPDAVLTLDQGRFKIPFILGLYPLSRFGRIAWLEHGRVLALGAAAPALEARTIPMFWHPLGLGLPVEGAGHSAAVHFDTGANASYLYPAGLALLARDERTRLRDVTRKMGGVGGIVTQKARQVPRATLTLAGQQVVFRNMDVAAALPSGEAARLGADIFPQFDHVVLDFRAMRLSAVR